MISFNNSSLGRFKISSFNTAPASTVVTKALMGFVRRIKAHKEMRKLHRLDNRMLKDIGLYRADLDWAMQQSERIDPLCALQERRHETLREDHLVTVQAYCKAAKN